MGQVFLELEFHYTYVKEKPHMRGRINACLHPGRTGSKQFTPKSASPDIMYSQAQLSRPLCTPKGESIWTDPQGGRHLVSMPLCSKHRIVVAL